MNKRLRHKRMISYYAWFRKIRTPDYKPVAVMKGSNIITNDALFIERISEICTMKLEDKPDLSKNKLRFIAVDANNKPLAKVDRSFNVYTMDDIYVGTIYNPLKFWIWFLLYILILLLFFILGTYGVKKTGVEVKPKEIVITEKEGNVVVDECNILYDYYGNKLIAPGRYTSYYFNVTNDSSVGVDILYTMRDDNEAKIPMVYRLYDRGEFVVGSMTDWIKPEDVSHTFHINPHETVYFRLDWHWEELDDEFDTALGIDGTAIYTIYLIFDMSFNN